MPGRPTYPFDVHSRDVWRIALPASFAFITEPLVGTVDVTVIGRLGDPNLLGGLVLGAVVFDLIFALAYFLRVGTAGLTAQSVGARDPHDGLMHLARAVGLAVVIGLAMILLSPLVVTLADHALAPAPGVRSALATYIQVRILAAPFALTNYALLGWFYGRAAARTGMALQIVIHSVNIAASLLFVFGFGWGVAGVAAAAVLGGTTAAIIGLVIATRHFGGVHRTLALLHPRELFDAAALARMFRLSRDVTIRSLALVFAYAWFAAAGSRAGEVILSANAVLLNILMISGFFLDGIGQAAEQLCGKSVGANWRPAFDRALRLSMRWGLVIAVALAAVWFLAGAAFIDFLTTSPDVRETAYRYLPFAACASLTGMPAFVLDGVLIGATLNRVMRNGMLVAVAIYLGAAFILERLLGNAGLWLALHVFFVSRAVLYWIAVGRNRHGLFAAPASDPA
ncbi:MAG: MATE family efflux transporter [Rhizobiales bacterium]|nr:MATE family efflux transporter [Hyphomicrobiales bacterium]MBN9010379.1 MATE family efflux transporter [Hyphomicrobiales bacterium]